MLHSVAPIVAYLLSQLLLLAAGLRLAAWSLRPSTRAVRCIFALLFWGVTNGLLVQVLGFAHWLWPLSYLAATLLPVAIVQGIDRSGWRFVDPRLPLALPFVSIPMVLGALWLLVRGGLVVGTDSLNLHGPMIVEWVQNHRVDFQLNPFRYPTFWEFQQLPVFLVTRGDAMVFWPRLLILLGVFCCVRELARRSGLPGRLSLALAATCLAPLFFHAHGTLKADPAFAFGVLASLVACDRILRARSGGFALLIGAGCFVLGTKPSGFLYCLLLWGVLGTVLLASARLSARRGIVPGTQTSTLLRRSVALLVGCAVLVSANITQLRNLLQTGNPVFPFDFELAGVVIAQGRRATTGRGPEFGSAILDVASMPEVWRILLEQLARWVTPVFPLLLLVCLVAPVILWQLRRRSDRGWKRLTALWLSTSLLWLLYFATPFSAGRIDDLRFLEQGLSLRYALAAIVLTQALCVTLLYRVSCDLRRRPGARGVAASVVSVVLLVSTWTWIGSVFVLRGERYLLEGLGPAEVLAFLLVAVVVLQLPVRRSFGWRRWVPLLLAVLLVFSLCMQQGLDRRRRTNWVPACQAVTDVVAGQTSPWRIGLLRRGILNRYLLYGSEFQNRIVFIGRSRRDAPGYDPLAPQILDSLQALYLDVGTDDHERALGAGFSTVARCRSIGRTMELMRPIEVGSDRGNTEPKH